MGDRYIPNPTTIGEKLRNRRLELHLFQKEVAQRIGVSEDTITNWEKNRGNPSIKCYPKIIEFLGYVPFEIDTTTLGGKIKLYRYMKGISQEALAYELSVNESTVFNYENDRYKPFLKTLEKLQKLFSLVEYFTKKI